MEQFFAFVSTPYSVCIMYDFSSRGTFHKVVLSCTYKVNILLYNQAAHFSFKTNHRRSIRISYNVVAGATILRIVSVITLLHQNIYELIFKEKVFTSNHIKACLDHRLLCGSRVAQIGQG